MKYTLEIKPNFKFLKERFKNIADDINNHQIEWTKEINKEFNNLFKGIFNNSWHVLATFDEDTQTITVNCNMISRNRKTVDFKYLEHLLKRLKKECIESRISSEGSTIDRKSYDELLSDLHKYYGWNLVVKNNNKLKKQSADTTEMLIKEEEQAILDIYYFLVNYQAVQKINQFDDLIDNFCHLFPALVKDVETINLSGALFSLKCLLVPSLLIPIIERDINYQLPIFIQYPHSWEGDNAFERFNLFLSNSVKRSQDDGEKHFVVVDSVSLIESGFDFKNCYHYSYEEVRGIMISNNRIPKRVYSTNDADYLHQYVITHFVCKYRDSNIFANDLHTQYAFFEQAILNDIKESGIIG